MPTVKAVMPTMVLFLEERTGGSPPPGRMGMVDRDLGLWMGNLAAVVV